MVPCKNCSTPNTLDSTFCKRCGAALPEDEVQASKEKLDALIAEGNTSFNEGRTDEALAVAETALASNPSSTSALSLKSLCHERRGDLAEALECADRIVELNPDSELDKIKRNQLRSKLAMTVQLATQEPDRKSAVIGAVAAVVLMICLGFGVAKALNRNEPKSVANTPKVIENSQAPVQQPNQTQVQPTNVNPPVNPSLARPNTAEQPQDQTRVADNEPSGLFSLPDGGGLLPKAGNGPGTEVPTLTGGMSSPQPSKENDGKVVRPRPTNPGSTKSTTGTDDPTPTSVPPSDDHRNDDPGKIEIKLSDGVKRGTGGGSENVGSGGAAALVQVGMQRYQLGQYNSAAASFEQAIRAGGDQMSLNQRLGQCYDNMGRKNDAIEAYKRGIAACQSALSNGGGNKDRIQRRLESCQQALKVLQGN